MNKVRRALTALGVIQWWVERPVCKYHGAKRGMLRETSYQNYKETRFQRVPRIKRNTKHTSVKHSDSTVSSFLEQCEVCMMCSARISHQNYKRMRIEQTTASC
jgi:hypothetical protein